MEGCKGQRSHTSRCGHGWKIDERLRRRRPASSCCRGRRRRLCCSGTRSSRRDFRRNQQWRWDGAKRMLVQKASAVPCLDWPSSTRPGSKLRSGSRLWTIDYPATLWFLPAKKSLRAPKASEAVYAQDRDVTRASAVRTFQHRQRRTFQLSRSRFTSRKWVSRPCARQKLPLHLPHPLRTARRRPTSVRVRADLACHPATTGPASRRTDKTPSTFPGPRTPAEVEWTRYRASTSRTLQTSSWVSPEGQQDELLPPGARSLPAAGASSSHSNSIHRLLHPPPPYLVQLT
ncbi:hypothetical protein V8E36_008553 [Tilletia maclaganii]